MKITNSQLSGYLILVLFFSFYFPLYSQEETPEGTHTEASEEIWPHKISIMTGYAYIPNTVNEKGLTQVQVIPAIGLDYSYFFSEKWGVGLINDIEFAQYLVQDEHGDVIERENKYIGAVVAIFETTHWLAFYAGPGMEIDKHEHFTIFKFGLELAKRLNDGWAVGITASIDVNEVYETISGGVIVSKRFPGKKKD